jgi:hypothetical protein
MEDSSLLKAEKRWESWVEESGPQRAAVEARSTVPNQGSTPRVPSQRPTLQQGFPQNASRT